MALVQLTKQFFRQMSGRNNESEIFFLLSFCFLPWSRSINLPFVYVFLHRTHFSLHERSIKQKINKNDWNTFRWAPKWFRGEIQVGIYDNWVDWIFPEGTRSSLKSVKQFHFFFAILLSKSPQICWDINTKWLNCVTTTKFAFDINNFSW